MAVAIPTRELVAGVHVRCNGLHTFMPGDYTAARNPRVWSSVLLTFMNHFREFIRAHVHQYIATRCCAHAGAPRLDHMGVVITSRVRACSQVWADENETQPQLKTCLHLRRGKCARPWPSDSIQFSVIEPQQRKASPSGGKPTARSLFGLHVLCSLMFASQMCAHMHT